MKYFAFAFVALVVACIIAAYTACTFDVGQPNITLGCVVVVLGNSHVMYCDAGAVTQPSGSKDAGTVSREQ